MGTKDYVKLLQYVLKVQIEQIEEDMEYDVNEYLQGQVRGLEIALDKIDKSKFLYDI